MTIKRFGVQLAASGIVVLLGALGVSQAQRESKPADDTAQWDLETPPAMGPPPPIAADPADAPFNARSAGNNAQADPPAFSAMTMPGQPSGIRQVNHEESFALPPQTYIDQPTGQAGADSNASDGPSGSGFALPAWSNDPATANDAAPAYDAPAQPSFGYAFSGVPSAPDQGVDDSTSPPPYAASLGAISMAGIGAAAIAATDPQSQPAAVAMPTLQFDAGPASDGPDSAASAGPVNGLRDFAAAPQAQATDAAPTSNDQGYGDAAPPNAFAAQPAYFAPIESADEAPVADAAAPPAAQPAFAMPPSQPASDYSANDAAPAYSIPQPQSAAAPIARVASSSTTLPSMIDPQAASEVVLNEPGDRRLDGMQSPSIVIHKRAPEQVKVGKPATFVIQVQNVGGVEALDVQVHDRVPAGMRLVDATPQPQMQGDLMLWQLGALEPGGERTISMQLVPEAEGELGSVARVTFEAAASVRTFSTRPALKITQRAPQQVLIGQQLEIELEVSNPGTGVATGVILQADVPDGFEHPKGRELDNLIGTLAPGETRRQVLRMRAVAPGNVQNQVRLVADDELTASDSVVIEVVAPQLAIELEGPTRRFLERQATYQINIANVGSAEASNVEIVAYLDRGFSFVGTEFQGQYDASRHAVYWSLAELPVDARGAVPLTLLPIEQGERAIRLEARGDLNLIARHEKKVSIDALAELTFSITDDADPIEVGSTATYEIRIINRGSGDDADVKLKLQLPPGLELVSSESDASTDGRGMVIFAPQTVMAARSETVHRVRVKGTAPGTHVVKAIVASREAPVAVTKEESTTVYADE